VGLPGYDALVSFRFPNGFGIGVGSLVLVVNVVLLGGLCLRLSRLPSLSWGHVRSNLGAPGTAQALRLRELSERKTPEMGLGKPVLGRVLGYLRPPLLDGDLARLENHVDAGVPTVSPMTFW